MDVGAVSAVVAGVDADSLTELFLDQGREGCAVLREWEAGEGEVGCLEGAGERADEVGVRSVDSLGGHLRLPEVVRFEGLGFAGFGECCIVPMCRAIAVLFGPVAIPSRRAIVRLGNVMPPFAVTAEEEDFILHIAGRVRI